MEIAVIFRIEKEYITVICENMRFRETRRTLKHTYYHILQCFKIQKKSNQYGKGKGIPSSQVQVQ
jgi:hypothetical protein